MRLNTVKISKFKGDTRNKSETYIQAQKIRTYLKYVPYAAYEGNVRHYDVIWRARSSACGECYTQLLRFCVALAANEITARWD